MDSLFHLREWAKKDVKRFPRGEQGRLEVVDVLSIFHSEAQKADARAFKRLLEYLHAIDEKYSTGTLMYAITSRREVINSSTHTQFSLLSLSFRSHIAKNSVNSIHVNLLLKVRMKLVQACKQCRFGKRKCSFNGR